MTDRRNPERARALLAPAPDDPVGTQSPDAIEQANQIEQAMLSARTLHNAGYTPPRDVQVRLVESVRHQATVAVSFDRPSGLAEEHVRLSRQGTGRLARGRSGTG